MSSPIILIADGYPSWQRYYTKKLSEMLSGEYSLRQTDTVDGLMAMTEQYGDQIAAIVVADDLSQINTIETAGTWIQKLREQGWSGRVIALVTNSTMEEVTCLDFTVVCSSREFIPATVKFVTDLQVGV